MSETGHSKNVAQFAQLVSIVSGFGVNYKPSNLSIELTKLQNKLTTSQSSITAVEPLESAETLVINDRQTAFAPLSSLVTRVVNAAAVSVNDQLFSNDLRTIARKLQGKRATPKVKDDPLTPDVDESKQSISASQMSYDNRVTNFSAFITLLESSGSYSPNETALQTATLKTMLTDLQAKNTAVVNASTAAKTSRIARDEVLYNDTNGIVTLANLVKKYVKSVFGADSPQYKQLTALKFKKP